MYAGTPAHKLYELTLIQMCAGTDTQAVPHMHAQQSTGGSPQAKKQSGLQHKEVFDI